MKIKCRGMFQFLSKITTKTIKKIDYEDVIYAIKHPSEYIIINTLPREEQGVLIPNTMSSNEEEKVVNDMIQNYTMDKHHIIVYGRNANDDSAEKKYHQLKACGFFNVYLYGGGLFEWLLLQDIYGEVNFPTVGKAVDFLRYKPPSIISRVVYRTLHNG